MAWINVNSFIKISTASPSQPKNQEPDTVPGTVWNHWKLRQNQKVQKAERDAVDSDNFSA